MLIPKWFQVSDGAEWYKVISKRHTQRSATMGWIDFQAKVVTIPTHDNVCDMKYSNGERSYAFWHEVTHAILADMNNKLNSDEKFVTAFSRRLAAVVSSAVL
jgi:hypothetical protein